MCRMPWQGMMHTINPFHLGDIARFRILSLPAKADAPRSRHPTRHFTKCPARQPDSLNVFFMGDCWLAAEHCSRSQPYLQALIIGKNYASEESPGPSPIIIHSYSVCKVK